MSNFSCVSPDLRQLELQADPVRHDARPEDVLWEVALREGYALTARIETVLAVVGQTVYRVSDDEKGQSFLACLDETVRLDNLRPLKLAKDQLFICRDAALDDTTAANLALQCRLKTI